ncbi:hypothetical protein NC652_014363 [Populus alba x Populus x berolinensis]|nr:hypothetical protein NC652_014363 [Populus alba x Populus x berolinensis]
MSIEEDGDVESCGSRAVESYSATANPSARHHHQRQKLEVYNEVLKRLQDSNFEEANVPGFDDHLWLHFNRLPARYVMDVNVERAEDVLMHKRLLQLAENPANRPAFEVHLVQGLADLLLNGVSLIDGLLVLQMYPSWNGNFNDPVHSDPTMKEDAQSSYFTNKQGMLPPPTFGSSPHLEAFQAFRYNVEDGDGAINSTPCRSRPMHEITFSTVDRPKLLSQVGVWTNMVKNFQIVSGFQLV